MTLLDKITIYINNFTKQKLVKQTLMFLVIISIVGCSNKIYIYDKALDFEIYKSSFSHCKTKLEIENESTEVYSLTGDLFKQNKFKAIIPEYNKHEEGAKIKYFLFKDDILVYFGDPQIYHFNENDTIRNAGEEITKFFIKRQEIYLKYLKENIEANEKLIEQ